jgi:hypothetical protein
MTFEQQNIGGRPFAKPELRELPDSEQLKDLKKPGLDILPKICDKPPEVVKEDENVRKTSEDPKKAIKTVHSKSNKPAMARLQKKL